MMLAPQSARAHYLFNQAPVADAGRDTLIVQPASTVTLQAAAIDSDGTISTWRWTRVAGPTVGTIATATAARTNVTGLTTIGVYLYELTVTDNAGATARDTVRVTVNPAGIVSDCGCDRILRPQSDGGIFARFTPGSVAPGEKICIMAGTYSYISLEGLVGTAARPISITNCGGPVLFNGGASATPNFGIRVVKSRFFRVSGSGAPGVKYGLRVDGGTRSFSSGLAMADSVSNVEIENVEVRMASVGFIIKTNAASCAPGTWAGAWEISNLDIHDNYVHNTQGEGFYIGNTMYTATVQNCAGATVTVETQTTRNVKVYRNLLDTLGWDGIQVATTVAGVEIYDNVVRNYGTLNIGSQQAGIILGGKSNGRVYNNVVNFGTGNGIQVFGSGTNFVYNNLVVNAGRGTTLQDAMFIDDRPAAGFAPLVVKVVNNTVVTPGRDGIRASNTNRTMASGSEFVNNLVVAPGTVGSSSTPYIIFPSNIGATQRNNINRATVAEAAFVNAAAANYRIQASSPARNAGAAISSFGFAADLEGVLRPSGAAVDAGAYEFIENSTNPPAPATAAADFSTMKDCVPVSGTAFVTIYDEAVRPVFDIRRNATNLSSVCWSKRIVTQPVRSYRGYYGQAAIQDGGFFQRNYLLDPRGQNITSTANIRFIITAAELNAFIAAYNLENGTSCTAASLQVVQYRGANADLDYGNNVYQANQYTALTPTITAYGANNSLRYIEVVAVPSGEFWLALTCEPQKNGIILGNAIQQRKSPSSSLRAWFRADQVAKMSPNAMQVSRMNDLSGNGRHAVQTTPAFQPVQVQSSRLNGQPALQFFENYLDAPINIGADQSPFLTVYTVANHRTGALLSKVWGHDNGAYGRGAGLHPNSTGANRLSYLAGNKVGETGSVNANQSFILKSQYCNNGHVSALNAGTNKVDTGITNVSGKAGFTIGNVTSLATQPQYNEFWDGEVAEVVVFGSLLSNAQQIAFENYLAARYNLKLGSGRDVYSMDDTTNGNYDRDVVGIGMAADASAVLSSTGLSMLHLEAPANLGTNEWLFAGHNGLALSSRGISDVPAGIVSRLARVWRTSEVGEVGTVDILVSADSLQGPVQAANLRLMMDANNNGSFADENMADSSVCRVGEWLDSTTVIFRRVNLTNATRFTLGSASFSSPLRTCYVFSGSGNFSNANNWKDKVSPTFLVAEFSEVVIDPVAGECVLDVPFTLRSGMRLVVAPGKKLLLPQVQASN
ncbi:MAG: right-handed parallel beta-helix repeat-containing protein [Chitinophagaceae bacterium]|nr:right-handed parallel beta-helix repeat-containing protein [Chitinophagaceae bacterium]